MSEPPTNEPPSTSSLQHVAPTAVPASATAHCPWCSAPLPDGSLTTCPSCGAQLAASTGSAAAISGMDTASPVSGAGVADAPGSPAFDVEAGLSPVELDEAIEPPSLAVRREMLRIQQEDEHEATAPAPDADPGAWTEPQPSQLGTAAAAASTSSSDTGNGAPAPVPPTEGDSQVASGAGHTYVLNRKLMSWGGDLWIEDDKGNNAFQVDGRAFSLRRTLVLQDPSGNPLYEINQSLAHVHATFEIKRDDALMATIQKALLTFLGDRFTITLADGQQLSVAGDFINREFTVTRGGSDVIVASRRWLTVRDSYGVQVAPGFDTPLALAIVVALEQMELEKRER
jgi:uncharacterized protein YxjI